MRYQSTTGLRAEDVDELVARIWDVAQSRNMCFAGHKIGFYRQVVATLTLLGNNTAQMLMADMMLVSQPTISRIYRRMLPLLETVLAFAGITLEQAVAQRHLLLVDGTYIPTGNRPSSGQERANFSGKHRCQRLSVQVACTEHGELVAVSDPVPGSRHDSKALELCGWSRILNQQNAEWIADSAYIATTALTPIKKTPGRDRLDWERAYNRAIASRRAHVEHCIAHLKDWKMLATGYRGRLQELPRIIAIIARLELHRLGW